ncbi:quaternary amine ABC transporter ATP-binding protein [Pararhizobium haloflavum]|uniref:quaternary amine ABC transporter ATP-binding protein n=1 Tax=Pararhizobium haloflavum TaxID=2037914 RepID=UPI000C19D135|nr:glycine betaine/L-proline ABC transporter ATP-binding protein [Pararhizobium haloflavum]
MATKVTAKNIYKIFGDDTDPAFELLKNGRSKAEILAETSHTVGVNDASFDVAEGEIFVVMGLSGSGKSTLVRMINGLIAPTRGEILIDGTDVASCPAETLRQVRREKVAMVFQHFALFPHKTVVDNVAYGLKVKGMAVAERREKALAALAQVGLDTYADSYPDELSGGMQQRVGLARGLAAEPEILLMDEPFSALDPLIRRDMQEELLVLQRTLKKTIIFITHDLNEALILGDKIAIMKDGRFVQVGTAQEIVGSPADDYVAAFTQDIDRSRVFSVDSIAMDPAPIELGSDTIGDALARMEDLGRDALFATENGSVTGIATYRALAAASRRNKNEDIRTVLRRDFETIAADAELHALYEKSTTGLPVGVVDAEGTLVGVVEPQAIFAQLVRGESEAAAAADKRVTPA